MQVNAGSTSVSVPIYARSSTGDALTGKVAADFALWYARDNGTPVSVSATGIAEVGAGEYRLTFPDAAFASGSKLVTIGGTVAGGVVLWYPIALTAVAADVWANTERTLTTPAAQLAAQALSGSSLTVHRGDTLIVNWTGLGSLADAASLWFTAKSRPLDAKPDTVAMLQVEMTGGLLYLAGASAEDATLGSLAITNETTGAVTLTVEAQATASLAVLSDGSWDLQVLTNAGVVRTLTTGAFAVTADTTRAIE